MLPLETSTGAARSTERSTQAQQGRRPESLTALAAFFVGYLAAHVLGMRTLLPGTPVSPLWPPAGVALAGFLLIHRRRWGWLVGLMLAANLLSSAVAGVRVWLSALYLIPALVELSVALALVQAIAGKDFGFRRMRDTFVILVAGAAGSGAGGVIAAAIARVAVGGDLVRALGTWWSADLLGIVTVTPLLLAWIRGSPLGGLPLARRLEGAAFLVGWGVLAFHVFEGDVRLLGVQLHPYILASLMVYAAVRLGVRGVTAAQAILAWIAVSAALRGNAHFPLGGNSSAEAMILVPVFLLIVGVSGLLLAAAIAEGRAATEAARESADRARRANRALRTIGACNEVLVGATSEQELLTQLCRVIVQEGGFTMAWVGIAEHDEERRVRPVAHYGYQEGYLESLDIRWSDTDRGRGPTGIAIRTQAPVICHDILTDPTMELWREHAVSRGYRAFTCLPLRSSGSVLGTLSVYAPDGGAFDDEEMRLLAELADDLAFGMVALRRRDEHAESAVALVESEARFQQLAENIREVFWMLDARDGHTLYVSPGAQELFGVPRETLTRTPDAWPQAIHRDDRERVLQMLQRVRQGEEQEAEYRLVLADGRVRHVQSRAFPVRNADGVVYRVAGVTDDVTERRQIEAQLRQAQKLEAIGQLAGGIAHDFNNILGAILMQSGMARAVAGLPPDAAELLQDVEASAQRAANLTRQLLLFGRKQVMQPRDVELNDLVATLARMLRRVVPEHVQLQLAMPPHSLPVVGDPGMLEQAVMNLTVNARDAMPDGGHLTIETFSRDLDDDAVLPFPGATPGRYHGVRVRDTGVGIPAAIRPRIFEPFFTTKEPGKGTGLGLATTYGIVRQHRGVILVDSREGDGTTFELLFPATHAEAPERAPAPMPLTAPDATPATVLVVEDDAPMRRMLVRVLEGEGYRVHQAHSGRVALEAWEHYAPPPDLVFTDLVMPDGVNGVELARQLTARSSRLRVIYSSGYDPESQSHASLLEPGVNFLQKPATPRQIVDIVTRMLAREGDGGN